VRLTTTIQYRIDGLDIDGTAAAEYPRWSYIGVDRPNNRIRFVGPNDEGVFLSLDRLVEIDLGHLELKPA
jgi:hypothetical protein